MEVPVIMFSIYITQQIKRNHAAVAVLIPAHTSGMVSVPRNQFCLMAKHQLRRNMDGADESMHAAIRLYCLVRHIRALYHRAQIGCNARATDACSASLPYLYQHVAVSTMVA